MSAIRTMDSSTAGHDFIDASVNGYPDITSNIDLKNVECLNEQQTHHLQNAISPGLTYLESDVDEQLSIFITFLQRCKIFSLSLQCLSAEQRPMTINLFKNRPNAVDFDEAVSNRPTETLKLTEKSYDKKGTAIIRLLFVKFQDICILDNLGCVDSTRIDNLRLYGETSGPPFRINAGHKAGPHRGALIPTLYGEKPHEYASTSDIDKAILSLQRTVEQTGKNHPNRPYYLMKFGIALITGFERTGSTEDLNRAITVMEQALEALPNDHPELAMYLNNLAAALHRRFGRTGSMDDLDLAIATNEQVVAATPYEHPDRAMYLNNLGAALQSRFERTDSMDDLDRAIATNEKAVLFTQKDHPDRAGRLNNLGNALQSRFERTGSMDDICRAVAIREQAVASTPIDHPNRASKLNNLGNALQIRFERTGSLDDLDRAITTNEEAVAFTPKDHPDRSGRLNNLGLALKCRFERTGSREDLDRAITTNEKAVALTPDDHPDRATYLTNLGDSLEMRFNRTGSMDDLNRAITINEQAVAATPQNHPYHAAMLNNLGIALQSRFHRTGSMNDLDRAIAANKQAVESTPSDHPNHAGRLDNLGAALQSRFERTGSIDDLYRSIMTREQAVESTPNDHPDRAARLSSLGDALQKRFERKGSMNDLDLAITTKVQAVESTPDDHPSHAGLLMSLANSLHSRFEWTGSMDDVDNAIVTNEQVLASTPNDHPDRAIYLNNLGIALQSRFKRTGSMSDLDRAIVANEQAVASTPNDHPNYAAALNNLAVPLLNRFERKASMDDLDRAIATSELAVTSTPNDHPDRAARLNNFGNALQSRFERTGSMDDLDRVIATSEEAVASTQNDDPNRAMFLNNLGTALHNRFKLMQSTDDLDRAITTWEEAFAIDSAPPSIRLNAASFCSDMIIHYGTYYHMKPILRTAVHILPTVSPRALKRRDQQYNISQFANITSRAVSLSLVDTEDPYDSLQLLELGRGILANLQLEVRSDISVLAASHPDLAHQFQELRDRIDAPRNLDSSMIPNTLDISDSLSVLDSSKSIAQRHALINEFDNLLQFIRSLHGFENFLKAPSKSELLCLAKGGPIVVFNVSDIRSDAFLITADTIQILHLTLLQSRTLEEFTMRFLTAIHTRLISHYEHSLREVTAVLEWLWDVAVGPILERLGFSGTPGRGEQWPRVWWVGNGLLNVLPIHAAGYDSSPQKSALSHVISSYTPTIKSLAYSRENAVKAFKRQMQRAILIGMSETPGHTDLPFVRQEIDALHKILSPCIDIITMENPTRQQVLSELPKQQIIHLSCHGFMDSDPSQSSFFLRDWQTAPLTVSDLQSLNVESGIFAYLSACHSSGTRNLDLLDESISLASAIQLCGYPSVVGTLWQVEDKHSADVTMDVYVGMLDRAKLDISQSAEALHWAVCALKDRTRNIKGFTKLVPSDPLVWAPYIHIGV